MEINEIEVNVLGQKMSQLVNVYDNILETIFISSKHNKTNKGGIELFIHDNSINIHYMESNELILKDSRLA